MSVDLRVDLDLAVRHAGSDLRRHARHELAGSDVRVIATTGGVVEETRFDAARWRSHLARSCRIPVPDDAPAPPADGLVLPWDLVVGTGAALAEHRFDLYDQLVARAGAGLSEPLRRLHRSVGRLRVVGTVPARRRVGWVTWVLFADGWHALTPSVARAAAGPQPIVRLDQRRPEDLATDVARWAAAVPR